MRLVPKKFCLACRGCCRFRSPNTVWLPFDIRPIPYEELYICPHLNYKTNKCKIYSNRPLDCKIYPFILTKKNQQTYFALHKRCLFIEETINKIDLKPCIKNLIKYLTSPKIKKFLINNPDFIKEYPQDELIFLEQFQFKADLIELSMKDKKLVEKYLKSLKHSLSVYSFSNIYLWKAFYKILYSKINGALCLFFKDKSSCFMNLAPLGKDIRPQTIDRCFEIMNSFNKNKEVSRIENIEPSGILKKFRGLSPGNSMNSSGDNFKVTEPSPHFLKPKFSEYLYLTKNLIGLKGNKFKSKRAPLNYFLKNYNFQFLPFEISHTKEALSLYEEWAKNRKSQFKGDEIYCLMIDDSLVLHKFLMQNFNKLNLIGFIVKINGKIKAYSFGYPINKEAFCIFAEIADLSIKGLSQFIFWRFCKELSNFKFINTMDDSGLTNLNKVKLSYYPYKLINSFILTKKLC